MKLLRPAMFAIFLVTLTSCQTLGSVMNVWPVRLLDQTASALMGYLAENELPANGKPASVHDRARQVESRGIYAGRGLMEAPARRSMAAR